jgi:hypothetical protein
MLDTLQHPLQKAWDKKRALRTCKRGHPLSDYEGLGTVRRCSVCDRMRQLITDSKNKIGPVMFRPGKPPGLRTHCPQGHPYSGTNLRLGSKGRICRTCAKASVEKWKRERIEQGENPNRWKPRERTVDRILQSARNGLSISEMKGRVRGVLAH